MSEGTVEGVTKGESQPTPYCSEMTREPFSGTAHAVKKKKKNSNKINIEENTRLRLVFIHIALEVEDPILAS